MNSIAPLMNKHAGEWIWVVGTGPSLDNIDDADIVGPRIYLNRTAFDLPASEGETYWMVCDDVWGQKHFGPWSEHLENVLNGSAKTAGVFRNPLMAGSTLAPPPEGDNTFHFDGNKQLRNAVLNMTREQVAAASALYQYAGTAGPAIHLAWFMGAAGVNLVGVDGTDGYAERLLKYYEKSRRGGCGYLMARESAGDVINALDLKVKEWGKHAIV